MKDERPLKRYRSLSVAFGAFSIKLVNGPLPLEILLRYVNGDLLNAHRLCFNLCNEICVIATHSATIVRGINDSTKYANGNSGLVLNAPCNTKLKVIYFEDFGLENQVLPFFAGDILISLSML